MKKSDRKKLAKILELIDNAKDALEDFVGNSTISDSEQSELDDAFSFLEQAHSVVAAHCPDEA